MECPRCTSRDKGEAVCPQAAALAGGVLIGFWTNPACGTNGIQTQFRCEQDSNPLDALGLQV